MKILKEKYNYIPEITNQIAYVKLNGMTVIDITPEERQKFIEATKSVFDKWVEVVGKELVDLAKKDMGK